MVPNHAIVGKLHWPNMTTHHLSNDPASASTSITDIVGTVFQVLAYLVGAITLIVTLLLVKRRYKNHGRSNVYELESSLVGHD